MSKSGCQCPAGGLPDPQPQVKCTQMGAVDTTASDFAVSESDNKSTAVNRRMNANDRDRACRLLCASELAYEIGEDWSGSDDFWTKLKRIV